jgi:hypothetical protein
VGHGAGPGIADGGTVVWIAPDYPQAMTIWREEVQPRFRGVEGVRVNEAEHSVTLPNGGALLVRSAESIDGVRGMGKELVGVVGDEAAHLDLEYALRNVLRPALLDNQGWLLLVSTPVAGSYFNALCTEVMAGGRGPDWAHWHGTPHDNPLLSPAAIAQLIAEYPPDSPQLHQEVFAELIEGGAGLAFPEWRTALHVQRHEPPGHAEWWGGIDWGYTAPGAFVLLAADGEHVTARWDTTWREQTPYDVGFMLAERCREWPLHVPAYIAGDPSMWSVSDGGPSLAEEVQRGLRDGLPDRPIALLSAPRGAGSRVAGKLLVHRALHWTALPDGTVPDWQRPHLTFHPDCAYLVRSLAMLPRDERKPEDVDTTADDHAYDAMRYALMAREPGVAPPVRDVPQDVHPGFLPTGQRRHRDRTPEHEQEEAVVVLSALGFTPGGRYGLRAP